MGDDYASLAATPTPSQYSTVPAKIDASDYAADTPPKV